MHNSLHFNGDGHFRYFTAFSRFKPKINNLFNIFYLNIDLNAIKAF